MAELDDLRRLAEFHPSIVTLEPDGVLQDCVRGAAERAETRMAAVTFVMRRMLLFRSAIGLPPELEATRGAARNQSFCQFVVTTEAPFVVTDARNDPRSPRRFVETYGVGAYLGVPVVVGGHILGALCVTDLTPRRWTPAHLTELRALALRVSGRLEALAALNSAVDEMTLVPPGLLASRASILAQTVQRSLAEIGPLVRLGLDAGRVPAEGLRRAVRVLEEAGGAYEEMMSAVAELRVAAKQVEESTGRAQADP